MNDTIYLIQAGLVLDFIESGAIKSQRFFSIGELNHMTADQVGNPITVAGKAIKVTFEFVDEQVMADENTGL